MSQNILEDKMLKIIFFSIFFFIFACSPKINGEKTNFDKSVPLTEKINQCFYNSVKRGNNFFSEVKCKNGFTILAPKNEFDRKNCFISEYSINLNNKKEIRKTLNCYDFKREKVFNIH